MPGTVHDDGPDTALARLLAATGRVEVPVLQAALERARSAREVGGPGLAELLIEGGLIGPQELEQTYVSALRQPDGSLHTAQGPLEDPEARLGRYVILQELGRGGMGVVLKGFDPERQTVVAIKKILGSVGPDELLRFEREAQIMGQLQHPGIASLREVISQGPGAPYLVIDFVEGETLRSRTESGPLEATEAAQIVLGIARAMAAAHELGVVHRDLKPDNVMLTERGPVVLDFGLARRVVDESVPATLSGEVLGTPSYMAPEQALARPTDARTDVYGMGAILYECLTGRPVFTGTFIEVMHAVRDRLPDAPSQYVPETPAVLEAICLRCLRKRPEKRYPSAEALARDLETCLAAAQASEGLARVAVPEHLRDDDRVPAWALGLLAAACVGALALGVYLGTRGTSPAPTPSAVASSPAPNPTPNDLPTPAPSATATATEPADRDLVRDRQRALARARDRVRDHAPAAQVAKLLGPLLEGEPPAPAPVLTDAGLLLLQAGALKAARECLKRAAERDTRALRPLYWLDVLEHGIGAGRSGAWCDQLRERAAQAGGLQHPLSMVARARLANARGEHEQAVVLAGRALTYRRDLAPALCERAAARLRQQELQPALDDLRRAWKLTPVWPVRYAMGRLLIALGETPKAEELFDELLVRAPDDVGALIHRGRVYLAQQRYVKARRDLDRALALGPQHAERYRAFDARGTLLRQMKRVVEATRDHRKVLELAPQSAHAERGRAHLGLGQLRDAERCFTLRIQTAPTRHDGYEGRAVTYHRQGKPAKSLADLETWSKVLPQDPNPLLQRGQLLTQLNRLDQARAPLDRAIQISPRQPEGYFLRGLLFVRQRNRTAARADFDRAYRFSRPGSRIRQILDEMRRGR